MRARSVASGIRWLYTRSVNAGSYEDDAVVWPDSPAAANGVPMSKTWTITGGAIAGAVVTAILFFVLPGSDTRLEAALHPGLEMSRLSTDESPWLAVGRLVALGVVVGTAAIATRWSALVTGLPALVLGVQYAVWFIRPDDSLTLYDVERLTNPLFPFTVATLGVVSLWQSRRAWAQRSTRSPDTSELSA